MGNTIAQGYELPDEVDNLACCRRVGRAKKTLINHRASQAAALRRTRHDQRMRGGPANDRRMREIHDQLAHLSIARGPSEPAGLLAGVPTAFVLPEARATNGRGRAKSGCWVGTDPLIPMWVCDAACSR